jgi:alkanesulfonate monooxygenase SsuD/methylene tetrahydromethanopterin reductase-like flavin-dependent oxidoreductase (luciferase family)
MSAPALGIIFHPKFPPETLADYARRAETVGFDELWLWNDCFLPGAFTSATIALAATQRLRVGIGLLPAPAYNPLFAAMDITTLARAFPGRFLPGFGHGVGPWMAQIGAAPKSSLRTLDETVHAVRRLLGGETVTMHGDDVNLEQVQMQLTPAEIPPLYIGAMREKSLRLAGSLGDGTILTGMSSPAYVTWAREQVAAGMVAAGRSQHRLVVYLDVKVNEDGSTARAAMRQCLAARWPWADVHMNALGIAADAAALVATHGVAGLAERMPDAWVDALAATGTPDQVAAAIPRWHAAGADSVVFQPLDGDPDCLDEYIRCLRPTLELR